MLRILLAISAAAVSAAVGSVMSERLKKRYEQLRLLIIMLDEMTAMMKYRAVPVDEMVGTLLVQPVLQKFEFLALLKAEHESDVPLREAWRKAAEKTLFFSDSDRGILYHIGERLGRTDTDGQLSLLGLSREFAERNLTEAQQEYRAKSGIYRKTGLLCGIALGILIL